MEQALRDLAFLAGLTNQDFKILAETAPHTAPWADELVKAFYDLLYGYEATRTVFKEGERPKLEAGLRAWYFLVTEGKVAERKFWQWQWFVGLIHIKRQVRNPMMLGTMSRVQQLFLSKCLAEWEPARAEQVYTAFKRVTDVVVGLIAESYYLNYVEAMESVTGMRRALTQRMMDMEVDSMMDKSRRELEALGVWGKPKTE